MSVLWGLRPAVPRPWRPGSWWRRHQPLDWCAQSAWATLAPNVTRASDCRLNIIQIYCRLKTLAGTEKSRCSTLLQATRSISKLISEIVLTPPGALQAREKDPRTENDILCVVGCFIVGIFYSIDNLQFLSFSASTICSHLFRRFLPHQMHTFHRLDYSQKFSCPVILWHEWPWQLFFSSSLNI